MDLPDPPDGWRLTHLIDHGLNDWQAHLLSEDSTVIATGTTARYAMLSAIDKIGTDAERTRFCAPRRANLPAFDLIKALGIGEPALGKVRRI